MTEVKLPKFKYKDLKLQQNQWVQSLIEGMALRYAPFMKERINYIRQDILLLKNNVDKHANIACKIWEDILFVLEDTIKYREKLHKTLMNINPSPFHRPIGRYVKRFEPICSECRKKENKENEEESSDGI